MDTQMSQRKRTAVLAKQRDRYARAGKACQTKIINERVELFAYHLEAAIRALPARPLMAVPFVIGRPKEYDPDPLRAPLKAIWLGQLAAWSASKPAVTASCSSPTGTI